MPWRQKVPGGLPTGFNRVYEAEEDLERVDLTQCTVFLSVSSISLHLQPGAFCQSKQKG